jgi:hypothetical protein
MRNSGQWTEAKYQSFIKSALRSASVRWPPRYSVLADACVGSKINPKSGRMAKHYRCKACQEEFPAKDVQVNHIFPVIPTTGFDTWDAVIERMFCEKEALELLCKPCHASITKIENTLRKVNNANRKTV